MTSPDSTIPQATILLIDDTPTNLDVLGEVLTKEGFKVLFKRDGMSGFILAKKRQPDLILLDVMMPEMDGFETCEMLKKDEQTRAIPVLFMSALSDTVDKVRGLRVGAVDYITKPFQVDEVKARLTTHLTIRRLQIELEARNSELKQQLSLAKDLMEQAQQRLPEVLIGQSEAVRSLRKGISLEAESAEPLLLVGRGSVGEEQVARAIHKESARCFQPFVRVDCIGSSDSDFKKVFGGEDSLGKWQLAGKGTLYFDRPSALPSTLQKELGRRLQLQGQTNIYQPKVIAFSQKDLNESFLRDTIEASLQGLWRVLKIPNLSARSADIPELVQSTLSRQAERWNRQISGLDDESLRKLETYDWPGNLQELSSVLECALHASKGPQISIDEALLYQRRVGSYELTQKLAKGGMGEVWLARHRMLVQPAAVKLIRTESLKDHDEIQDALKRFELEAQTTATLRSPNTVRLFDYGTTEDGSLYYVMELLDGIDLYTLTKNHGPQLPERVAHFMIQACGSLAEAHSAGLIHRDIKPANLFACKLGVELDVLKVLDFGLVKQVHKQNEDITKSNITVGTPMFMSPEAATGRAQDGRSDIYSLGLVMYWLLTAQRPYNGETDMDVLISQVTSPPPNIRQLCPNPLSDDFVQIIEDCLRKAPDKRPENTLVLRKRLLALAFDNPWTPSRAETWWQNHREYVTASENETLWLEHSKPTVDLQSVDDSTQADTQ